MDPICYRCTPPQIFLKSIAKAVAEGLVPIQKCLAAATAVTILTQGGGAMTFHVCSDSLKPVKNLLIDTFKYYVREQGMCTNSSSVAYSVAIGAGAASYFLKDKPFIVGAVNNLLYTMQQKLEFPIPDWLITIIIEYIDLCLSSIIEVENLLKINELSLEFLENSLINKLIPSLDTMFSAALLEINFKIYAYLEPYLNELGDSLYQSYFYQDFSPHDEHIEPLNISSTRNSTIDLIQKQLSDCNNHTKNLKATNLTYVELCIKDSSSFECESAYWNRLSGENENHIDN